MARNTINIEFNQYIVTVATIVAAVAAGYLAYATGIVNPLVAAATAGAIGFAVSYLSARSGAAVIILGALVFFFTFTQAPPRPSTIGTERHSSPRVAPIEAPRTAVVDAAASVPLPEMVRIPAGSFLMGSPASEPERDADEGPQHRVQVAAFELGKSEVTFAQWDACVATGGCTHRPADEGWGRGNQPVINVSWDDVQQYVTWLSRQTGQTWRLPTEAEWEYAARAGTTTAFSTGNCITTSQAHYNSYDDYAGCGTKNWVFVGRTRAVGSYPPNRWGLYDLHGNVHEWVQDCSHDSYTGAPQNGSAWLDSCPDSGRRVLRGGSWFNYPRDLRAASRVRNVTGNRDVDLGFRVARTLTP